jgi:hypothetical protein
MTTHDMTHSSERLRECILLRLFAAGKTPPTKSTFDKQFRAYFADPVAMSSTDWRDMLDDSLQTVLSKRWVQASPLQLTEEGRAHLLRVHSVNSMPTNIRWQSLRNRYLIARALRITPRSNLEWERLGTADGLRAATLTRHYELPLNPVPTVAQALNALAWLQLSEGHELTVPFKKKFTRDAILRETLLEGRPGRNIAEGLAARVAGSPSSVADKVRDVLISKWIHGEKSRAIATEHFDLAAFANEVCELARTAPSGRFGDHKVFISHVWNCFYLRPTAQGMTHDDFKRHLVEANREDLLALTRADLITDMTPEDVHQSEIRLPNSCFHFIRTDTQAI